MKRRTLRVLLLACVFLTTSCTPPTVSPNQPNPAVPSSTPLPARSSENAIYGNELPAELQDFTIFGKSAASYSVTMVSPRLFERFVAIEPTLSDPKPHDEESLSYEPTHPEGPTNCQEGNAYRLHPGYEFAAWVDEVRCTGGGGGSTVPGVLRNNTFSPFTGYEQYIESSNDWNLELLVTDSDTAVWTMSYNHPTEGFHWVIFAGNLETLESTYLGSNTNPLFEQGTGAERVESWPYYATMSDGRLVFVLDTMHAETDPRWSLGDVYSDDGLYEIPFDYDHAFSEALFSIRLDGTDARKELDPVVMFNVENGADGPLLLAVHDESYALLLRTEVGQFTEILTSGWRTQYRPHPYELFQQSTSDGETVAFVSNEHIMVAQKDTGTLTVVATGTNPTTSSGGSLRQPVVIKDYLMWDYHNRENSATGIYLLNLTTYKGLMTVINGVPGTPVLETDSLRIPIPADDSVGEDMEWTPLYQQGFLPLP